MTSEKSKIVPVSTQEDSLIPADKATQVSADELDDGDLSIISGGLAKAGCGNMTCSVFEG